ncbi:MAG TPA: hypothetical protein VFA26_20655 [Gemmataceae bacterium]|nr:hypothetical protein [Gemmataceae bacterium]
MPAALAVACDTPVFRYALESWPADPYRATVYHHGPLTAAERATVKALEEQAARCNLTVRFVDVAQHPEEAPADLADELPHLVVRLPATAQVQADVWSGPLSADILRALVDSPARRQVAERLLAGDTAVWVLLRSGDAKKDGAAERTLRAELEQMRTSLKPSAPEGSSPEKLAFSVVRLDRADAAEALLVRALLASEPDLAGRPGPMVFPVFGRGRVLYALVGDGITAENLRRAGSFLVGACSCTVKRENPGVDLLLTADWPPLKEARSEGAAAGESVPIPSGSATPLGEAKGGEGPPSPWLRYLLLGAVGLAALLVVATGAMALRGKAPPRPAEAAGPEPPS